MKWIIRIVLLVVIIVAGTFLYAAYRLNDIAAALKPKIIETVKTATGGDFNFGDLSVHAFPSPHIELQKVSLSLPQGINANADSIATSIKLGSILSGNIEVSSVSIKNGSGSYSKEGLPKPINFEDLSLNTSAKLSPSGALIDNLTASTNLLSTVPVAINGSDINFNIATKEVSIGKMAINLSSGEILVKGSASPTNSDLTFNGNKLSIKEMIQSASAFSPGVPALPLSGELTFDGSSKGLPPTVETKIDTNLTFNGEPVVISANPIFKSNVLDVTELDVSVAKGEINGKVSANLNSLSVLTSLKGSGIELSELIKFGGSPIPLTGKVSSIVVQNFGANSLMSDFSGTGTISVQTITIPGINLFGRVADQIKTIPGVSEMFFQGLSPAAQAAISSNATELSSAEFGFVGKGNSIALSKIEGLSTLFSISGIGSVVPASKSGNISINMFLSEELSAALTRKLKGGTGFMENGKIKIPIDISFSPAGATVTPKMDALLKGAVLEAGKQILNKALSGDSKGAKDLLGGILGF